MAKARNGYKTKRQGNSRTGNGVGKPTKHVFRKNLADAMYAASLNQTEVGKAIGVRPASVSRYLSGESEPNFDMLDQIANALGRPVAWFLEDHSQRFSKSATIDDVIITLTNTLVELKALKKKFTSP